MTADIWLDRADRNLRSARLTLDDDDPNSACGLAYYAMFYSARAAPFAVGEKEAAVAKAHSGLIAAFNLNVARSWNMGPEHSRNLGTEANRRLLATYQGGTVDQAAAVEAIEHATASVDAVRTWVAGRPGRET